MSKRQDTKKPLVLDRSIFQRTSLIPILALVGLGSDGLSSSCYGPEEAYVALGNYPHLIIFVALISVLTIWALCTSYGQIIELFPRGGGGYLVASKLLSPHAGLISGCALLVDYVLTVTISVAAGIDALFSLAPAYLSFSLEVKVLAILALTLVNLKGVKESVFPWIPVFALFCVTHLFAFAWSAFNHHDAIVRVAQNTMTEANEAISSIGFAGFLMIIMRSFTMGAGTFTGIEAVSNGMSIIREPKIKNAKKTMIYIAASLSIAVLGLVVSFLLYDVRPQPGQTINAVLLGAVGDEIGGSLGRNFQAIALFSETALLFVAAETGFLGGPQVLSNMSLDRWFPHKFASLSDRFVMRRGILLMGIAASIVMLYTSGSVTVLVILYSLAVFITFTLSQLGMVLHWWKERHEQPHWFKKFLINGFGALVAAGILTSIIVIKFVEGAWLTLVCVAVLVLFAMGIKKYYTTFLSGLAKIHRIIPACPPHLVKLTPSVPHHTAVMMVGGIGGLAQHCIANVLYFFGPAFDNFVFLHVGLLDAGSYKGEAEIDALQRFADRESNKLVKLMRDKGYSAESMVSLGIDITDEIEKLAKQAIQKYPACVFLGGQLVLPKDTILSRWLHNQTLYAIQRRLYALQYPCVTVPIYFKHRDEKMISLNPLKHNLNIMPAQRYPKYTAYKFKFPEDKSTRDG